MDAQTRVSDTAALVALVQCLVRREALERTADAVPTPPEVLEENRFLAARDGMEARLIDPELERRVPARELLAHLLEACRPHARALGCESELASIEQLFERTGAERQLDVARQHPDRLPGLVSALSEAFTRAPLALGDGPRSGAVGVGG